MFGFRKTFRKISKNLGVQITCKSANLQEILFTKIADNNNVINNSLHLFVPILVPSTETQRMFNEPIKASFILSFHDLYTGRRLAEDSINQVDIGTAQSVNSPRSLICAQQAAIGLKDPDKNENIAVFDNLNIRNSICEIYGQS